MPTPIQSIHPSLAKVYEPQKKNSPSGQYYDFNNDGKVDAGELISENQTTESILEHVVYAENNTLKIKQVYDIVTASNDRTQQSINTFESNLIARAALLASGVEPENIPEYFKKLNDLFFEFEKDTAQKKLLLTNEYQKIDALQAFLWKDNPHRAQNSQYSLQVAIDRQTENITKPGSDLSVGNCVSLTALTNIFLVRLGIHVKIQNTPTHVFSVYKNRIIENTNASGTGYKQLPETENSAMAIVADIYQNRAILKLYPLKEYQLASALLKKSVIFNSKNSSSNNSIGTSYMYQQQYKEALPYFKKAIALEPNFKAFYFNLALAYANLGNFEEAKDQIKIFLEKTCESSASNHENQDDLTQLQRKLNPQDAESYYQLGSAYEDANERQQALACYEMAISINPQHAYAHNDLSFVLLQTGKNEQAYQLIKKAIALNPTVADFYNTLGLAAILTNRNSEAQESFKKALALAPTNSDSWLGLTLTYFHQVQRFLK
jgi:tetratricopeptide (TPR) repeat protein